MRLVTVAVATVAFLAFRSVPMRKIPVLIAIETNHDEIIRMTAEAVWRNYEAARKLAEATQCRLKQAEWRLIARFSLNVHFWRVENDRRPVEFTGWWGAIVAKSGAQ